MKQFFKIIILLLGGLLIMLGLSACGERIPENRTKEQYELEKEFQPLFDFLAEEEKDLSNVKLYSSKIFMMDENADSKISRSVYLKPDNTGEYVIEQGGQTTEFHVQYNNRELQYDKEVPQEYDLEVLNLELEPEFFQELSIFDYMTKHPGTGMKRIDYNIVDASKYFNNLKEFQNSDAEFMYEIYTAKCNDEDWQDEWKKYFHTVNITDNIVIKPSWDKYEPENNEIVIEIDPGLAFGTGTHETTSLCVEFLEKYSENKNKLLDIGCGSGILMLIGKIIRIKLKHISNLLFYHKNEFLPVSVN